MAGEMGSLAGNVSLIASSNSRSSAASVPGGKVSVVDSLVG
jgi:hypothetical protein